MLWLSLGIVALVLSLIPTIMVMQNLPLFRLPKEDRAAIERDAQPWSVSLLIPARDESIVIKDSLTTALASDHVDLEIIVMDDGSTDGTDKIVQQIAAYDPRVVYRRGGELPANWNGKQHACWQLSKIAKHERMLFIDADVRLQPDGLAKLCRRQDRTGVALLSAFPSQVTDTFWERLLIPMMHYILLGYLPFARMRSSTHPAYASGCGQLFMTRRSDYIAAGTHESIRGSRHDGVKLPRTFRESGLVTDVIDGTSLAQCRMYSSGGEVFRGVLKNASEGIANARLIVLFTVLLLGGSVLPIALIAFQRPDLWAGATFWTAVAFGCLTVLAVAFSFVPRATNAGAFRQSWVGVLFHPIAVLVFVILQWIAFFNHLTGRQVAWRGRTDF